MPVVTVAGGRHVYVYTAAVRLTMCLRSLSHLQPGKSHTYWLTERIKVTDKDGTDLKKKKAEDSFRGKC